MSFVYDSESSIDGSLDGSGKWEASSEDSLSPNDSPFEANQPPATVGTTNFKIDALQACNRISTYLEERGFVVLQLGSLDDAR